MDHSPTSRRARKSTTKSDIYSTFVVHSDDEDNTDADGRPNRRNSRRQAAAEEQQSGGDIYATVIHKNDADVDGEDDDDESLPPLLKRLPKDFGADVDSDDNDTSISGTMIVKTDRRRAQSTNPTRNLRSKEDFGEEDEGNFSTFVVRSGGKEEEEEDEVEEESSVSGTMVVSRTSGHGRGGGGGSTMSRAVASMQAVGDRGFGGKQKKASGGRGGNPVSSRGEEGQLRQSSSSIPDSVTKEDPSTKYELLHELGKKCWLS